MNAYTKAASLGALVILIPSASLAQDGSGSAIDAAINQSFDDALETAPQAIESLSSEGAFGPAPTLLKIESESSGETVTLTISNKKSQWKNFRDTSFALSLSAPLDDETERGEFLTQVGLPNAYTIGLSASISMLGPDKDTFSRDIRDGLIREAGNELRNKCHVKNVTLAPDKKIKCDDESLWSLLKKFDGTSEAGTFLTLQRLSNEQMRKRSYVGLQVVSEIGKKPLSFRDPNDISLKTDANKTVFSASTSVLYAPRLDGKMAFIAGAEIERNHKLPDKETRCPNKANAGSTIECFNAAFGPPERKTEKTLFGAIRYNLGPKSFPISGEFRIAKAVGNKEWGIEAPLYLLRDSKGNLNGGIRVGYDSEKDDAFFGVFIGSNLDFLNPS